MALTITNNLLIAEGKKFGITYKIVSKKHNLVLLCFNKKEALIRRSRIPPTSGVLSYLADHKGATYDLLDFYGFSYPSSKAVSSFSGAKNFAQKIGYPVVVKPEDGAYGYGVTANIKNFVQLKKAFIEARKFSQNELIVQKFIVGDDYRILIVDFKVVAVAKRIPARVFGDGKLTVQKLIEKENQNPLRSKGHIAPLTLIEIDAEVKRVLQEQKLMLQSVPKKGVEVQLRRNANLSTGGEAEDVTDLLPQKNILLFEKIARVLDANVVGIDIRCRNITKVFTPKDYAVIEVNVSPGIRMHHFPSKGKSQNVARAILKVLFPEVFKK